MIRMLEKGKYLLFETKNHTRMLSLDASNNYAWIYTKVGEILVMSDEEFTPKEAISQGNYRIYSVKGEPDFTDLMHLELFVGDGKWQGYLLPTRFPDLKKKRSRIIPTDEVITVYSPAESSSSSL